MNITGNPSVATAVNGSVPAPVLHWREGDTVTLRVTNRLPVTTSIHWHGVLLPFGMDGVPGLSFNGIQPGETFTYRFAVKQSGTYWYHSHSRFQEQTGLYGPIVIAPEAANAQRPIATTCVMLSDWTTTPRVDHGQLEEDERLLQLQRARPSSTSPRTLHAMGLQQALAKRQDVGPDAHEPDRPRRRDRASYTYLINGAHPSANWTGLFKPGEKVRLRFINGSSQSIFDVRIPGLKMTVVAADGQDVEPVTVDEFRIAVAEIYDVIVEPGRRSRLHDLRAVDRPRRLRASHVGAERGMQVECLPDGARSG